MRERKPDLVAITGDLLTHPAASRCCGGLRVLPQPTFAVLGNHDVAISRDPQAQASNLSELEPATLLRDEGRMVELRGRRVWIAGVDPCLVLRGRPRLDPNELAPRGMKPTSRSCSATTRASSTCSSRDASTSCSPATSTTARSGCRIPAGRSASRTRRAVHAGVYRTAAATMHVSPGLGTTFVPFRFAARPEATELVLRQG